MRCFNGQPTSWFAGLCTSVSSSARFSSGRAFESSWVSAGIDSDQSWRLHHLVLPVQPMESIVQWRTIWINLNIICCVIFAACLFRNGACGLIRKSCSRLCRVCSHWWHDNPPPGMTWQAWGFGLSYRCCGKLCSHSCAEPSETFFADVQCWCTLGKYGQMICGVGVQNHNVLRVCQHLQAEDKTHQTIK